MFDSQSLSHTESMQCIITAFEILSGQGVFCTVSHYHTTILATGESLNIDPRQFFCRLYCNLLQLDFCVLLRYIVLCIPSLLCDYVYSCNFWWHKTHSPEFGQDDTKEERGMYKSMCVHCMDRIQCYNYSVFVCLWMMSLFHHSLVLLQVSCQRVLAFVKRLSTMSLQLPPGTALAVMAALRHFMQVHKPGCSLLSIPGGPIGLSSTVWPAVRHQWGYTQCTISTRCSWSRTEWYSIHYALGVVHIKCEFEYHIHVYTTCNLFSHFYQL